jgi:hypothetical protein
VQPHGTDRPRLRHHLQPELLEEALAIEVAAHRADPVAVDRDHVDAGKLHPGAARRGIAERAGVGAAHDPLGADGVLVDDLAGDLERDVGKAREERCGVRGQRRPVQRPRQIGVDVGPVRDEGGHDRVGVAPVPGVEVAMGGVQDRHEDSLSDAPRVAVM